MTRNKKKYMAWALVLMLLGVTALYAGTLWLVLLIPAAMLVWYGVAAKLPSGRN